MVYCGKPSKSCEACRKTKTKCDQKHPTCGQCARTRRVCPGYRDLHSVLFRDETARVVQKVNTQPGPSSSATAASYKDHGTSLPLSPPTARRDQAIGIFFYQYATGMEGCFDYMPAICSRPTSPESNVLHDTMELVGLAYLSGARFGHHSPSSTEIEVYRKHSTALQSVNNLLTDMSLAIKDETLAAVILLSLFETVTCMAPKSFQVWSNHVQGATALVQARGTVQFETTTGRRMFSHLLDYVMLSAMQRFMPIPDGIIKIAELACTAQTPAERAHQELFKVVVGLAELRYQRSQQADADEVLLSRAKSVDAAFEKWLQSVPVDYAFTTVPAMPGQDTLNGVYYVYPSLGTARIWDIYRMCRLLNAEIIGRQAAAISSPASSDDLIPAKQLQLQLCSDICDSMAFYLLDPNAKAIVGVTIVWPLYTLATIDNVTLEMRLWALRQMRDIALRTVAMQGLQISDALSKQWDLTIWARDGGVANDCGEW